MVLLTSCTDKVLKKIEDENLVRMSLSCNDCRISKSSPIAYLNINIKNNSKYCLPILKLRDFSTYNDSYYRVIIENERSSVLYMDCYTLKRRLPRRSDYCILSSDGEINFNFKINFSQLAHSNEQISTGNLDFGRYKVHVLFHDDILLLHNSIPNLKSNIIEIDYNQ